MTHPRLQWLRVLFSKAFAEPRAGSVLENPVILSLVHGVPGSAPGVVTSRGGPSREGCHQKSYVLALGVGRGVAEPKGEAEAEAEGDTDGDGDADGDGEPAF
jgi:hypothetical protein